MGHSLSSPQSRAVTPLRWMHSLICWKTNELILHPGRETLHPAIASCRFLVIPFSNLIKYSLFLDFRWLYVNPNTILQWVGCLRGQQGTFQSQIKCLNEFFGELKEKKKKRPYFPVNTIAWIQWAFAHEQKWMPQILKSFWANYYMMIKYAGPQYYKWTIMG